MPRIAVNRGILVIRSRLMELLGWTRADFDRAVREDMPVESRPENRGGDYALGSVALR